jgi:hypothetical protein
MFSLLFNCPTVKEANFHSFVCTSADYYLAQRIVGIYMLSPRFYDQSGGLIRAWFDGFPHFY